MSTVFRVFAAIFTMLLAFVAEILHPIHMELEFEQVELQFPSYVLIRSRIRPDIWSDIWS
ncbi:hypothetical protein [Brevibacillus antibioticus]|uniref:hypothetical protein n=1 Tax=Brevibacillus antibioticus TaxID=2570228 RepID=UPI00138FA0C0|nr:hypothetical protein [Brevibacillus antibioticus]